MAILRMVRRLDEGQDQDLRQVLNTPNPEEDVFIAADRWLSALDEQERRAMNLIGQLEEMIGKRRNRPA